MKRYHIMTTATIMPFESQEREYEVCITCVVDPGCAADLYGDYPHPAEPATAAITKVEFRKSRQFAWEDMPRSMADDLFDNDETRDWLLTESAEADAYAADVAADHRREMAREERDAA